MTWQTRMLLRGGTATTNREDRTSAVSPLHHPSTVSEWARYLGIRAGRIYGWIRSGLEARNGGTVRLRVHPERMPWQVSAEDFLDFLQEIQHHASFGQLPPNVVRKVSELIDD